VKHVPGTGFVPLVLRLPAGAGAVVLDLAATPPAGPASLANPGDPRFLAIRFANLTAVFLPLPDPPAEQIYRSVKGKLGPEGVAGAGPGVVDNLYLSWLFQYGGLLGSVLCALWAAALLWPMVASFAPRSLLLTARLWGVFLIVAAFTQDIWEKVPVDLVAALVLGLAAGLRRRPAEFVPPR
jgi:hypothetical protein